MRLLMQILFILALGAIATSTRPSRPDVPPENADREVRPDDGEQAVIDDQFVYDLSARFNETVTANVDAIDTELIAVLVGDFALAIFSVDKIQDLEKSPIVWGIGAALGVSIVATVVGYLAGSPYGPDTLRDGIRPRSVMLDLVDNPASAIGDAVRALVGAGEENLRVRRRKRIAVLIAIVALAIGTVLVGVARATVKAV